MKRELSRDSGRDDADGSAMSPDLDEDFWEDLLTLIDEGKVTSVVLRNPVCVRN